MTDKRPTMMTTSQVAELIEVDPSAVLDWIHAGKFPGAVKADPTKRTSTYLIPTDEVEKFKKERDQSLN